MRTAEEVLDRLNLLRSNPYYQTPAHKISYPLAIASMAMQHETETLEWVLDRDSAKKPRRGASEVRRFGEAMVYNLNLSRNADKGSWQSVRPHHLYDLMTEECGEVLNVLAAIDSFDENRGHGARKVARLELLRQLLLECGDVANYAMMLADVYSTLEPELMKEWGVRYVQ